MTTTTTTTIEFLRLKLLFLFPFFLEDNDGARFSCITLDEIVAVAVFSCYYCVIMCTALSLSNERKKHQNELLLLLLRLFFSIVLGRTRDLVVRSFSLSFFLSSARGQG